MSKCFNGIVEIWKVLLFLKWCISGVLFGFMFCLVIVDWNVLNRVRNNVKYCGWWVVCGIFNDDGMVLCFFWKIIEVMYYFVFCIEECFIDECFLWMIIYGDVGVDCFVLIYCIFKYEVWVILFYLLENVDMEIWVILL